MKHHFLLGLLVLCFLSCENTTTPSYDPEGVYYGPAHVAVHNSSSSTYLASCETRIENTGGSNYRFIVTIPGHLHDTIDNVNIYGDPTEGLGFYYQYFPDTLMGNFIVEEKKLLLEYRMQDSSYILRGVKY